MEDFFAKMYDLNFSNYELNAEVVPEFSLSKSVRIILTIGYGLIFGFGFVGNCTVIFVVFRDRLTRKTKNVYFVSLSIADMMIVLLYLPLAIYEFHKEDWIFGLITCKLMTYFQYISVNASVLTIFAIYAERCVAVCFPLKARSICTKRTTAITTSLIWIGCCLFDCPVLNFVKTENSRHYSTGETATQLITKCYSQTPGSEWFVIGNLSIFYLLPGVALSTMYVFMSKTLNRNFIVITRPQTEIGNHDGNVLSDVDSNDGGIAATNRNYSRKRVHAILTVITLTYFIFLLPFNVILLLSAVAPQTLQSLNERELTAILVAARVLYFANCCLNPFLYSAMSGQFRAGFRRTFLFDRERSQYTMVSGRNFNIRNNTCVPSNFVCQTV